MSEQYAMPKVSTIIRETGRLSSGSYYTPLNTVKESKSRGIMGSVLFYFFNFVSMAVMTMIFVASIALTLFVLDTTANSSTVITMQTQEVPSDGLDHSPSIIIEKKLVRNIEN